MIESIKKINSFFRSHAHRADSSGPRRIFKTLIFHFRPRQVNEKTLRFTLTFGLGGIASVLVGLLLFTGILLKFVYEPFPVQAYDSIIRLQTVYPFGRFIRNIHFWSANILVGVMALHGLRVYFTQAFRPPRRLNWLIGLSLFVLILAANLTGYLLPWDQLAYWATTICIGMLEYLPIWGGQLQEWVMGGPVMGASTLRNFFALHTAVLPLVMIILMAYHFWRIRKAGGLVTPRIPGEAVEEKPVMVAGNPDLLLREAATGLATIAFIFLLAVMLDAPLGPPANSGLSPNPTKAPWYFNGVQEMLVHIHPTFALLIVVALVLGAFFILPYADGTADHSGVWLGSPVGRRTAMMSVVAALLITPLTVILDEYVVDLTSWMSGWPQIISNGLIPTVWFVVVLAGIYFSARVVYRASRLEAIQAVVVFLVSMFVILTLICNFFRVEGMKLGWVF